MLECLVFVDELSAISDFDHDLYQQVICQLLVSRTSISSLCFCSRFRASASISMGKVIITFAEIYRECPVVLSTDFEEFVVVVRLSSAVGKSVFLYTRFWKTKLTILLSTSPSDCSINRYERNRSRVAVLVSSSWQRQGFCPGCHESRRQEEHRRIQGLPTSVVSRRCHSRPARSIASVHLRKTKNFRIGRHPSPAEQRNGVLFHPIQQPWSW